MKGTVPEILKCSISISISIGISTLFACVLIGCWLLHTDDADGMNIF